LPALVVFTCPFTTLAVAMSRLCTSTSVVFFAVRRVISDSVAFT